MAFDLKHCALSNIARHPKLAGRTRATVNVTLRETRYGTSFDHNLTLRVSAPTNDDMKPDEVKSALLTKAAAILSRTMAIANLPEQSAAE